MKHVFSGVKWVYVTVCAYAVMMSNMCGAAAVDTQLFAHSVTIQFNGCTVTEPLENFPVAIKFAEGMPYGFSYNDCAVDSFRFTDTEGNVLAHDVECWNTQGTSIVWVSVPSLSKGMSIYFRYGAVAGNLPANTPANVWLNAGYVGVWHMNEETGAIADAAGNSLTATPVGSAESLNAVEGPIGNARCTAVDSKGYLSVPNYDSLNVGSSFTISGWVKMSKAAGYQRIFSRKVGYQDKNGWEIEMNNNSSTISTARAAGNEKTVKSTLPNLTEDWRLLAYAYEGNTLNVFGDGERVATGTVDATQPDNGKPLSIGCDSDGSEAYFQGSFDEVRLRSVPSTAEWLRTEYESVNADNFAVYSSVDQEVKNTITATATDGGLVQINDGTAGSSVQSEGVELGTSLTATVTAIPADGYRFFRWVGNVNSIVSGGTYTSTISVTSEYGTSLTAEFISLTGDGYIELTNAFDHPSGGFTSASYANAADSIFSVSKLTLIAFTAPEAAPAGLREFYHAQPSKTGLNDDWGYFKTFAPATEAFTQDTVRFASTEKSELPTTGVYTYAGSWYVPQDAIYSFRMHMKGTGQLVIDNQIILQQKSNVTAVTTNGIVLAQGWHNFYAVFPANTGTVAPADSAVCGLMYSAVNADLEADPSLGSAFATESGENAHRLSTAFNGVLVPSIWAAGGDVVIDCANALGDLRVAGQLGSVDYSFAFANLPAGRTVEVGRPANLVKDGYQNLNDFAWIDWKRTTIPAGVNVRFEGAVVLGNSVPEGHEWSLGKRVTLATTVPDLFGIVASEDEEFHLPSELLMLLLGNPSVLGDEAKIFLANGQGLGYGGSSIILSDDYSKLPVRFSSGEVAFRNDVELADGATINGTSIWDDKSKWHGSITGEGRIAMTGWGRRMTFFGQVVAKEVSAAQRGNRFNFCPDAGLEASSINSLWLSSEKAPESENGGDYFPAALFYCPQGEGAPPLTIGSVGGGATWFEGQATFSRGGSTLTTCSNNTINISKLTSQGIHLRTVIPTSTHADPKEIYRGFANFNFGSIDSAYPIYISSNVNVTVTNVNNAVTFNYAVNSNSVNGAVLDIYETCTPSKIIATDIAMLPARVKGFVGEVTLTQTETKTYPVVIDFSKDAPVYGGCDGSGTLVAAPANGAIEVSFAGDEAKAGDYGLARFTDAGGLLDSWTVATPTFYKNHAVAVVKDSTGLWLKVRRSGVTIIIR